LCNSSHPPPSQARWQVRYRDGRRERSAGIYQTPKAAEAIRKRIERGLPPTLQAFPTDVDAAKTQTLLATMRKMSGGRASSRAPAGRAGRRLGNPDLFDQQAIAMDQRANRTLDAFMPRSHEGPTMPSRY